MWRLVLGTICVALVGLCALVAAKAAENVTLRLRLVDAAGGKSVAGIVRIYADEAQRALPLPGLLDRLQGLKVPEHAAGWYVVPAQGAKIVVPRAKLRFEALSGLETGLKRHSVDLTAGAPDEIVLKLDFLFSPEKHQLAAGNTHLHLMKLSKDEAADYLRQIPAADRLRVLFISYLERFKDDLSYITNRYPIGDLPEFNATGVLVNNGEEHRHNFKSYGQGYGHVMFLNIKRLVKPVSLGPGITGSGVDDRPLQPGIDDARAQGGTVLWCHNTFGFEDVVNAVAGRLHGLNVFDGSRTGAYEDNYYRYLNLGMRLSISTGTDWFLYDFARVYVQMAGEVTIAGWLDGLKSGRNLVTNGPLLTLHVAGRKPGDTIRPGEPQTIRIEARAVGRHDFQQLQLIRNGKVVKTQGVDSRNPFAAKLSYETRVDQPAWFAARIESTVKNELDRPLYAHTSPVYIDFDGKSVFDVEAARGLLQQVEEAQAAIRDQGRFSNQQARERVLVLYDKTAQELRRRINQRAR